MNWEILITAGVVSTVISSIISFIGLLVTTRQQQRKYKFEFFFNQLLDIRRKLYEIEEPDITDLLVRGHFTNSDMVVFLERFKFIDDIYFPNEMLYDKDLRKKVNQCRYAVNGAVNTAG